MARPRKGKALTLMPIRVDDDVRAAILKLKADYETINQGLRIWLQVDGLTVLVRPNKVEAEQVIKISKRNDFVVFPPRPKKLESWRRGPRQKNDPKR